MEGRNSWSELPEELKVIIFDMMPTVKELISLKRVCKDWDFVITWLCVPSICAPLWGLLSLENRFEDITFHVREIGTNTLAFHESYNELYATRTCTFEPLTRDSDSNILRRSILALPPPEDCKAENIRDCCNGMVLFATSSNSHYYVGNPLTRQRFDVPSPPSTTASTHSSLVFDPSIFVAGNIAPFFKILSLSVGRPMEIHIYTSDKAEWCTHVVELEPPHLYGFDWLPCSVYLNRALYYLSEAMYLVCIHALDDVRARVVALPDRGEVSNCGCIGNCSDRLYYSNHDAQGSSILVWMLRDSSWGLMHTISISQDIGRHFEDVMPSNEHLMERLVSQLESVKKHDCFRPRLLLCNNGDGDGDGMTIYFGQRAFLSYNVSTRITDFQIPYFIEPTWVEGEMELDDERFFPFSPCPMVLKSLGTTKLVPISAYETIPQSTWDVIIPPHSVERHHRAIYNAVAKVYASRAKGSRINFCSISCVVGFICCISTFLMK